MGQIKSEELKTVENVVPKRQHEATYATDKKKGGYNIRVIGPHADKFAGREVPVKRRDGTESFEKLVKILWTGKDDDAPDGSYKGSGKPVALYSFAAKPPIDDEILF